MTDLATLEAQAVETPTLAAAANGNGNPDTEAIVAFAEQLSQKLVDEEVSFNIAFNGLTITLTGLLLDYGVAADGGSLNLQTVDTAFQNFITGLQASLRGAVDKIKADSEAIAEAQAEAAKSKIALG